MVRPVGKIAMLASAFAIAMVASTSAEARPMSMRTLAAQELRLATIAYRIATTNVHACPVREAMSGLVLHDLSRYDPALLRDNDLVVNPIRRLDVGVTLRPAKHVELAIWGQNLTEERHQEVREGFITPSTFVERGVYARLTTRFF